MHVEQLKNTTDTKSHLVQSLERAFAQIMCRCGLAYHFEQERDGWRPVFTKSELEAADPRTILPITVLPLVLSVLIMPMILRVGFMCVPPIVIMVRDDRARPLHFRASTPTIAVAIARYVSQSWCCAEKHGAAESQGRRNGNKRFWCTHELTSS